MRHRQATTIALAGAVALIIAACSSGGGSPTTPTGGATTTATPSAGGAGASPFVAPAATVKKVVVNVGIQANVPGTRGAQTVGNGSGVIIRSDGYILTNNHVVAGSTGVTAIIDSQTVPAKVVGGDASTDLAVIKVSKSGLTAAAIGKPSELEVGDWVVAVGYPFGVGKTVTHGIVSALGRSTLAPVSTPQGSSSVAAYTDLIQTDAPINPGNSGGALATLDGKVVGVNTLIESPSGASAGIGFAIPIDFAMRVADQLIKTGKAVHPFLGVGVVTLTPSLASQAGVEATQGVLVRQVLRGGPAAKAGMKVNDVIVQLAGIPVTGLEDLYAALRQQTIGQTVPVVVVRGKQRLTLQVTIASDGR